MKFLSAFASYGIILCIFMVVIAVAIFVGITLRKRKDASIASVNQTEKENEMKSE